MIVIRSSYFSIHFVLDMTDMPSTLMGQFMEALNSQTNLDDLNLNIDSFQGGLECNVDEVNVDRFIPFLPRYFHLSFLSEIDKKNFLLLIIIRFSVLLSHTAHSTGIEY